MLALEVGLFTNIYDYFTTVTKITMEEHDLLCTLMIFMVFCFDIYIIFADILGSCRSTYMKCVFKIPFPTLQLHRLCSK